MEEKQSRQGSPFLNKLVMLWDYSYLQGSLLTNVIVTGTDQKGGHPWGYKARPEDWVR